MEGPGGLILSNTHAQVLPSVRTDSKALSERMTTISIPSVPQCKPLPSSDLGFPKPFSHVDPLAVIEASLTSVKYAFYHTFGHLFLASLGYHSPTTTFLTSIGGGFIGGAVFTVPYLIVLPRDLTLPSESGGDDLDGHCSHRLLLLGVEMLYSAMAGGVGMVFLDGWRSDGVLLVLAPSKISNHFVEEIIQRMLPKHLTTLLVDSHPCTFFFHLF
ncbi:hypothetical protein FPV67DRAFT_1749069 [Lyophyllum atratum]|nr:hypothetical protein FPV67DRAFT_1749069 [Lyophyllum atratum]